MNLDVMMAVAGTLLMLCVYANRISMRYGIPACYYSSASACSPEATAPASSFIMPG